MRRRNLIPIVIFVSVAFNIGFALYTTQGAVVINWPFFDLGPAVIQDSFYMRAPGLESPFGIIGDIPGGYSLYTGNPLETGTSENITGIPGILDNWMVNYPNYDVNTIIVALLFAVVPLFVIIILGRKSYGSTKTQ
ncbi:MAG: hypothetical protein ACXABX_09940 [Candidatus Thorarchaeota archaeon]|jgi:hypothetical protein